MKNTLLLQILAVGMMALLETANAGTFNSRVVFTLPNTEIHTFSFGPVLSGPRNGPVELPDGLFTTAENATFRTRFDASLNWTEKARFTSQRKSGWDGEAYNQNWDPIYSLKEGGYSVHGLQNNIERKVTWSGMGQGVGSSTSGVRDVVNSVPIPPLLSGIKIPAGAKFVIFKGALKSPLATTYPNQKQGWSYVSTAWEDQSGGVWENLRTNIYSPTIELLQGNKRIGVTSSEYRVLSGSPSSIPDIVFSDKIRLPANWSGGTVGIRFWGVITEHYFSGDFDSDGDFEGGRGIVHHPTSGTLTVTTDAPKDLDGVIATESKSFVEGYKGRVSTGFSVWTKP